MKNPVLRANIAALRRHLNLKQEAFADRVGSKQSSVSKWESKGDMPEARPLAEMASLAGVTVAQFLDSAWRPPAERPKLPDQAPTRSAGAGEAVEIISLDLSLEMGPGTIIDDFVESEVVVFDASVLRGLTRTPSERLRVVTGVGNSHDPVFQHNDKFLIDINDRKLSRFDGYYWITFEGAHALKRLQPVGRGRIKIVSENPEPRFDPIEVNADDLRIEGRAIWFSRGL